MGLLTGRAGQTVFPAGTGTGTMKMAGQWADARRAMGRLHRSGPRRPPESSPPSPGGSSSTPNHRASRLSAAALSRAGSVACYAAGVVLVAVAALLALPLQAQATVWSATLTPRAATGVLGCSNSLSTILCSNSNNLSDDATTLTYTVTVTRAAAATNTPATDAPAITGTPQVGKTLTASKGTIADTNGTTKADNGDPGTYQWVRVDGGTETPITGAAAVTYTLAAADLGKTIKVQVSFKDDGDTTEGPLTSDATVAVMAAPGVTVSTTTLTVWEEDATGDTYTVVLNSQPTADIAVTVAGHAGTDVTPNPTSLTFTTVNWGTAQTVTVKAGNDADTTNDSVSLTHSAASTDADYQGITIAGVTVTVNDNDPGICGRTPAVRTAILAKIPGVSNCADVTDAHLAAITGTLSLGSGITTSLATEDFAGLTALTILHLNGNALTMLPAGVFDDLIALQLLSLQDNALTTLPAGVFEPLTALIFGSLSGNPGAPFAPEADALPDDGTVPIAGGTVTLGGSDSGPWGTNVTYSWALTNPASGVTVTFDDAASATPVVTIPALTVGTELTFTLTVTGRGSIQGTVPDTDIATVAATDATNTPATGAPAITGTPQVGEVLHAGTSGIMDTDGLTNVSYRHQWLRVDSDGASNETMIGSNAGTYTLVNDDEGKRIRVRVRFTDDAANPETRISAATGAVAPDPASGICGRTPAVREELLYLIEENEGATVACADVTTAHLAAITGYLALDSYGITALAAGDFAGLTALTELGLGGNALSTLPDDVFKPLTALTGLHLFDNDLSTLPAGVFAGLTALTELYLFDNALSTLPAGVFAGLTALTILDLIDNDLTTLPAGVFAGLTALTELYLDANALTTLPAGVFAGLTALTELSLFDNDLTTLPAGVFEPLTALTGLNLTDNPGAPFAPEADARPDDGTVPIAGGTVTLDGSDSGPWGTNVTYSWALTNPASGVTVTFDDAASATPVVTIPALTVGTELTFTLTVTGRGGTDGIAPATDTAKVTATATNAAPSFTSPATFDAAENQTAVGTVVASDGDADDGVTGYTIQGGADRSKFSIVEATGVLTFASAPNFEAPADADADNAYVVVVRAASGTGGRVKTADQTITVTVTDVAGEAPGVPAAPMVTSASVTSVTAAWAVPANAGPPITDYDYRYRVTSPQGSWTEVTNTAITGLSATITMLAEDTEYDVQVRATNDEGTSGWSLSGSGSTDTNAAPSFTSPATFDAAENQTAVGTVVASDGDADDGVTGYTIQGGADRSKFSIVEATGVLTFASAPNFEAPADADADNAYVVVVRAASGTGGRVKTADQTITVTVTDVAGEAPGVPAAPMVTSASVTSVTAAWAVPANAGPPITDYDYRYRVTSPQGSWTEVTNTAITGLSATITMLAEDTEYDVQVRATNDEGTSGWSLSGSGSTDTNAAPSFTSPATFDVAENQTAVGTVVASDGDADDGVTGYTIQGGADRSKFSIVEATGVLTFASAPNFEAPADADADNAYVVVVRAASGTGGRVKTADQTITVTVTDVAGEAPGVPAAPMVTSASVTSVTAAWAVPANAGPPITDYDYRYRVTSPQGSWTEVTNTAITGLSATITMLAEDTEYDVQVRATNDEGTSGWSLSGSGSTDTNAAPSFTSPATFDAAENQTAVGTVVASDGDADDGVTGYTIQGGADRSKFSIVEATGVLTFASAPNFEAPADADADNAYVVVVRAASGTGGRVKTADQTITVTVTDVAGEAPGVPAAPMVTSASVTSVTAAWAVPANAGPPITDYDYRYRVTSPQGSWTEVTNTAITGLSATITMLAEDTEYDVQVRATNDEGTSGWSLSGSGSTDTNAAPSFTSPATFDAAENQTAVGTVVASDGDADDGVTGYTIQGGADRSKFSIVEATGVLTFASAPNFEAPADADADNAYVVVVRADRAVRAGG